MVTYARFYGDTGYSSSGDTAIIDGVQYHRHANGGGLVADTARVAETAFIGVDAQISENAQISNGQHAG